MSNWQKFICAPCGKNQEILGRRMGLWRGVKTWFCSDCQVAKNEKAQ